MRRIAQAAGLTVWAMVMVVRSVAAGDPAEWKAGLARTVITPAESIWMAGFAIRTHPSAGVRQDICARSLALQDFEGKVCVLTTLDLVAIDSHTTEAIFDECRRRFGLTRDRWTLNVSHTHSGPVAGLELMPMYGDLTPSQREVIRRYTAELIEKTVATVGNAIKALTPARLSFGQGLAGIAVNRRRVADRSRPGPVDHDVPVLVVRGGDGRLRGVVMGYATHATAMNDYLISNDWPGFVLSEIEQLYPEAMAMFVQGCGADANPLPRRDEELARLHARVLVAAVEQVLTGKLQPVAGPLMTALEWVDIPFESTPSQVELQQRLNDPSKYVRFHAERLLGIMARDGKLSSTYPYPVQIWQFGSNLKFIALGGEVVVDYSLRLKKEHGFERTWVAGYSNDVMAYIPSARVRKEGGYEGGEAMVYFGLPGPFDPSVEEIIVDKVRELSVRLAPSGE